MIQQSVLRFFLLFIFGLVGTSCSQKKPARADSDVFLPSQRLAELTEKKLEEVSGLAASVANPGYLWTHNDSGNPAVVYLVDQDLKIRLACKLKGVKNRDWEDIAVGPGPEEGKRYVYVGDIGDNNAKHEYKFIYRFEEPSVGEQSGEITITEFDTIVFKLEDGEKDTETLLIHPTTGDVYVVSKREKPVFVYRLAYPLSTRDTLTAARVASLPLTQIVAGDFSPAGDEIVLKNYDNVYYWKLESESIGESLSGKPGILPYTEEPQGEALAFNLDGSGFFTLSEKIKGEKSFLYYYKRR